MADYDKLLQVPRATKNRLETVADLLKDYTLIYSLDTNELGVKLSDGTITYFGVVTELEWSNILNKPTFATVATSGAYADLTGEPNLDLKLDKNFSALQQQTNPLFDDVLVLNRGTTIYKATLGGLLAKVDNEIFKVVNPLPATGEANKIYLVPSVDPETQNTLDEFIWVDNDWERIGGVSVDLSGYFNKTEINSLLDNKVDKNANITAGTHTKITYDAKGLVTGGGSLVATDIPNLNASKINAGAFTADRIPGLDASKIISGIFDTARIPNLSASKITQNASYRFATDVEKAYWNEKVDKVSGKGLSTNDFTDVLKTKLDGIEAGAEVNPYSKTQLDGFFNGKVDKVTGKDLSTNDYTTNEKNKLDGIEAGAEVNVQSDWNATSGDASILNKPVIPTNVSQLSNDSGYITGYTETDPIFTAWNKSTGISITKSQVSDLIEATQALSGLMSATDKTRLDVLHSLLEEDTENDVVDSINEVLAIFNNYPEGADLVSALAGKVDKVAGKGLSTNDYTNTDKQSVEKMPTIEQDILDLESDKVDKNNAITAGTKAKITYDSKGLVTSGADLAEADIPALSASKISSGIFDAARIPNLAISKITSLQSTLDTIETSKQDKLVAGENITIDENTNVISASDGVDLDEIGYMNHAAKIYYASNKQNQFKDAWEHSLTVDPSEIERNSNSAFHYGKLQYPNGQTEGVIIPQGVTSIGNYAFNEWSSNNRPLVIPNSVTSIGSYAFYGWTTNNQPLVIPNSVTDIGDYAFRNWERNYQPLVIQDSVTSIGSSAFYGWEVNNKPLVIPDSVTGIGSYAFYGWSSNKQPLVIGNSVTSIGNEAFNGWLSNKHPLIIPNSVTSIGSYAFQSWTKVPYVEIQAITPPTLANANAFGGFPYLSNAPIYVPDVSVAAYKAATNWVDLADRIFPISDKPDLMDDIADLQENKQDKLVAGDNITIDENTNVISASGGGEVDLNEMAYFNYAGSIYGDKYSLLANAWEDMQEVDAAEIERDSDDEETQYGIPQYPNGEDNGVIIPDSVISIGDYAFRGWQTNNQPLVIPNSVTSIGGEAFSNWHSNNQPLVIPNSVTSIGLGAFSGWPSNNQPLVIPNSVTGIGNFAFYVWPLVPYVEIQAITPPSLGSLMAFDEQNDAPIYVPDESVDAYKTATNWVSLASRIFPISDKAGVIGDIESALDAILGV